MLARALTKTAAASTAARTATRHASGAPSVLAAGNVAGLTESQLELQEATHTFAQAELAPRAAEISCVFRRQGDWVWGKRG